MARDPLSRIELASNLLHAVRLSFDIEVEGDTIHVEFPRLPRRKEAWHGLHTSVKYGSGALPLSNVAGGAAAKPKTVARALCQAIGAPVPLAVKNVRRNYVEMHIPAPVRRGLIRPNHPPEDPRPLRLVAYVMFADIRDFSTWSLAVAPEQVAEVYELISERVAQMLVDYGFDYWKLLGDGIMLVWEASVDEAGAAHTAVAAAYELHKKYWYYRKKAVTDVPVGLGISVCGGHVTKYQSRTFFREVIVTDYIGPIVNQAARLQSLARPGEVLVNKRVARVSTYDWYAFEDVTRDLAAEMSELKGLAQSERQVFKVRHKYFAADWERFAEH